MGCLGSVPGAPSVPEIELDMEAVGEAITDAIEEIPKKIKKNAETFPDEVKNCQEDKWPVPDTTMELTKDYTEEDMALACIMSACGASVKQAIQDAIWAQFEPKIDEQLDAVEELNNELGKKAKKKAKDTFKEKTIDPLVDKAVDEALEAAKNAKNDGGDNE